VKLKVFIKILFIVCATLENARSSPKRVLTQWENQVHLQSQLWLIVSGDQWERRWL